MWLVFGMGFMGLLVGFLAGMTSSTVVQPLMTLLFAFVGGSIFVLLSKLSKEDRNLAGGMISSLSILCILGLAVGVHVSRGQYLVPAALRSKLVDECLSNNPPPACFLRSSAVSEANLIDADKRSGKITPGEAYDALYKLIKSQDSASGAR
ncbi:MAG: hypothetical protein JWQ49_6699 [Edaphobacter sp.]|nr:hypothetical protein [Edaphobacter sp.]